MRSRCWRAGFVAGLCGLAGTVGAAQLYRVDSPRTRVALAVSRFGVVWMQAEFRDPQGEFVIDRSGPSSRLEISVRAASVHCDDGAWDADLRSGKWLDTARFPEIRYEARRIRYDGAHRAVAEGQLTLHGFTRGVELVVSRLDCGGPGACRYQGQAALRRSDFGLPHGFWLGGDGVEILVDGQGTAVVPER